VDGLIYDGPVRCLTVGIVLGMATSAHAQSVNVSFGPDGSGGPSTSYAGAGAPGTWNRVTGLAGGTFHLVATDGTATNVTMTQSPTATLFATTDPSVSGDDAALLDNGLVTSGAETCLFFDGVQPGHYEVLVYAWLPNQPTVKSRTRQDSAPSTIDVGGAWTGAQSEGLTYARYLVDVGSDGKLPTHSGLVPGATAAALNGVQFRPTGNPSSDAGTAGDAGSGGGAGTGGDAGTGGGAHGGCSAAGDPGSSLLAISVVLFGVRRRRSRGHGA